MFRDYVRLKQLERSGYQVRSADDKHADEHLPKHARANFADTRRFFRVLDAKFPDEQFDVVVLDYFFSPIGFARDRWETWNNAFFSGTIPKLANAGYLKPGAKIFLPNLENVRAIMNGPIYHTSIVPQYTLTCNFFPYFMFSVDLLRCFYRCYRAGGESPLRCNRRCRC